jgi:hydrogenase nickel incorporation protein HypA/HybF
MHETALATALLRTAEAELQDRGLEAHQVTRLRVATGALRRIVPALLQEAWSVVTHDTPWAGVRLDCEIIPLVVSCADCGAQSEPSELLFVCTHCQSTAVALDSGDEFQLVSMEIET